MSMTSGKAIVMTAGIKAVLGIETALILEFVSAYLAAVYLAYGGMRNATIDNTLRKRFPGNVIPPMAEPIDALPHI